MVFCSVQSGIVCLTLGDQIFFMPFADVLVYVYMIKSNVGRLSPLSEQTTCKFDLLSVFLLYLRIVWLPPSALMLNNTKLMLGSRQEQDHGTFTSA